MNNLFSLFLSQSYQDCLEDYNRSVKSAIFPHWDYIILTASNEQQAYGFRKQIEERKGYLPPQTKFIVIPDRDGRRIGSGGATLAVLRFLHDQEGSFEKLRVLVIHSGGDSKRVPQYSALGKIFSPVPHQLSNGRLSTLFDEFLICMSSVPSRFKEGMMLLSGDVLLLFNPLQIDYNGSGAAAISFKEKAETGKNHGVFLNGRTGNVKKFFHKQTVETLMGYGAVNESGCVDIDTGAIIFSCDMLNSLYSLISEDEDYDKYVNEKVCLSLYGDFLFPLAEDSSLEQFFQEKSEGELCDELLDARTKIWDSLHKYRIKLLRLAPAKFIHFGTTSEILKLMGEEVEEYRNLGWSRQIGSSIEKGICAGYRSILSDKASVGVNCYLEAAYVHSNAEIGDNVVLSYIDVRDEKIPDNVVLHGLKQKNGRFVVRIYGVNDNPKENRLFGANLNEISRVLAVDLWHGGNHTLWTAELYPEKETIEDAIASSLELYDMLHGDLCEEKLNKWRSSDRKSLCSGFNDADSDAIITWEKHMSELVQMNELNNAIIKQIPVSSMRKLDKLTQTQHLWVQRYMKNADFSTKLRMHFYLGNILGEENEIQACFDVIQSEILKMAVEDIKYNGSAKIVSECHTVKLPLRVNWGGGWSDTPPYCNEHGGTVLNAAVSLNGEYPVEVTLKKISEYKIVFDSRDMDVHGEFYDIKPLQSTGDPFDPFALQKACLMACGILPREGGNLKKILKKLGGGFEMHSEVHNVPKGSGLGTSSILSAACVKAVFEFMGIEHTEDDLYSYVLVMEQIMTTGGGWQDQVGGVTSGIKYITSMPGIKQKLKVTHIKLNEQVKKELSERFVLIYTGQRRLARNLLRDVIGRYIGNESDSLYALNEIQKVAALMRFELERGNIDEFAKLLNYHWELSKKIDKGSSNTLIDQIFNSIDDLIDGKLVCGAGGGGFLQVILKKGVSKEEIHNRLKEVFQDSLVDVWNCELV